MRTVLAMLAFAALAGAVPALARRATNPPAGAQLCRPTETVVHSCKFGPSTGSVCAGGGAVRYRYGSTRRLELELSSRADWNNVRLGWVVGQQGGHQRRIRFTNGATHDVDFEGEDGQLAGRPGRTCSGVAVASGPRGEHERATRDCKGRARIHPDFTGVVEAQAPQRLPGRLDEARDALRHVVLT